ncbi:complement factor I [Scleropages formosus]|uniref:complement factor I n=1 Tax=Scleropages formosus TaxID=113540 RepID=UPI000878AA40|nr:complement factor I [Scleropages formosus]XP_018611662.1 complement factor I [Scleropages formosus]
MKSILIPLLSTLLIGHVLLESPEDDPPAIDDHRKQVPPLTIESPTEPSLIFPMTVPSPTTTQTTVAPDIQDEFLSSTECLKRKLTYRSCNVAFCPPWMRCLDGRCECKLPYQCPRDDAAKTCSKLKRSFFSYCQLKAMDCMRSTSSFSHFADDCKEDLRKKISLRGNHNVIVAEVNSESFFICGDKWNMAVANVMCREVENKDEGAEKLTNVQLMNVSEPGQQWPKRCIGIHCTGLENSLNECSFYGHKLLSARDNIATFPSCYHGHRGCTRFEFPCVNGKCIPLTSICDSTNDCGDGSDEMCCKDCRKGFHCKSNVCIPSSSVGDKIMDCLGGDDEVEDRVEQRKESSKVQKLPPGNINVRTSEYIKNEIKIARDFLEKFQCGVPNMDHLEPDTRIRKKRIVGGAEAGKTQFPWQVALQEGGNIDCGGTYIGGCWVLTAAHCVRPKPEAFRVKLSVWNKRIIQSTTDIVPVENIIIHPDFNPTTYKNDIALIELKKLPFSSVCFTENAAVSPACLPWSEDQFLPGDKCSVSGWGRLVGGGKTEVLQWADINIIGNCSGLYGHRYHKGMECAGALDGSVDSCQGDSGGPLICRDERGVAYIWGVVSWGEKCGVAGHPGVYTKVAYYHNWITSHIGRETASKYNL